jgi:hypothetical protein
MVTPMSKTWAVAFLIGAAWLACGGTSRRGTTNVVLDTTYASCPGAVGPGIPCPDAGLCRRVLLPGGAQNLCVPDDVCMHAMCEAQIGATSCSTENGDVSCPVGAL